MAREVQKEQPQLEYIAGVASLADTADAWHDTMTGANVRLLV